MNDQIYEEYRAKLAEVNERLNALPGIKEARHQGDLISISFEDGTFITLFPVDFGGSQGIIIDTPGKTQISLRR